LIQKATIIMTKAKVILSGIALFAVVGGALAFKANRTPFVVYTGTTDIVANPARACTSRTIVFTTDLGGQSVRLSTTRLTANCPISFTTAVEGI
jgi:hypothetical protein